MFQTNQPGKQRSRNIAPVLHSVALSYRKILLRCSCRHSVVRLTSQNSASACAKHRVSISVLFEMDAPRHARHASGVQRDGWATTKNESLLSRVKYLSLVERRCSFHKSGEQYFGIRVYA